MSGFIGDWHALFILLIAGVIPNQIWRMLGLWLGGGIDEGSELLVWVRAVATAILAGVIAEILVSRPAPWPACRDGCATRRSYWGLPLSGCHAVRHLPGSFAVRSCCWPANGGWVDTVLALRSSDKRIELRHHYFIG